MAADNSIISVMNVKDIFIAGKKGISEGFRRLAVLAGIIATVLSFDWAVETLIAFTRVDASLFVVWLALAVTAVVVTFYVTAVLVRIAGWVVDGFFKASK